MRTALDTISFFTVPKTEIPIRCRLHHNYSLHQEFNRDDLQVSLESWTTLILIFALRRGNRMDAHKAQLEKSNSNHQILGGLAMFEWGSCKEPSGLPVPSHIHFPAIIRFLHYLIESIHNGDTFMCYWRRTV